jgi:ubiquinone biosynthesis accessory factor UbiK
MCVQDATGVAHPRIPVTKASTALDALNQLAAKLDAVIKNSPVSELEKNARQHFISQLAKQGLVTREEFDTQVALLERARAKLKELEAKIALLEAERHEAQERHR